MALPPQRGRRGQGSVRCFGDLPRGDREEVSWRRTRVRAGPVRPRGEALDRSGCRQGQVLLRREDQRRGQRREQARRRRGRKALSVGADRNLPSVSRMVLGPGSDSGVHSLFKIKDNVPIESDTAQLVHLLIALCFTLI